MLDKTSRQDPDLSDKEGEGPKKTQQTFTGPEALKRYFPNLSPQELQRLNDPIEEPMYLPKNRRI